MTKISIITVVKNGMPYLEDCIKSFQLQNYPNKEHIIVYAKSEDATEAFLKKKKLKNTKLIYDKKSTNKFEALNIGIKNCTGSIIGILHADDIYFSNNILSLIIKKTLRNDIIYGNILISKRNNLLSVIRIWKSSKFKFNKFNYGWMPPHTSIFIKKNKIIEYSKNYKISGDYEFILNNFAQENLKIKFVNKIIVIMRTGGDSSNFKNLIKKFNEDLNIFNQFFKSRYSIIFIFWKIISKISQYKSKKIRINKYLNNFVNILKFILFNKIKNKNFIYAAFNTTFLGLVLDKIKLNKFSLWPDGIISKFYSLNKYPGSKLFLDLKLTKKIKRITVLGNLSSKQKIAINEKFYLPIRHIKVGKILENNIYNKKIKLNKNEILFITLPSPHQEIIANKLSQYNNYYKIICFGGALNILYEKKYQVPEYIRNNNIEFLYRLKTDTTRRLYRLIISIIKIILRSFLQPNFFILKKNI